MNCDDIDILLVESNKFEALLTDRALGVGETPPIVAHVESGDGALDFIYSRGKYGDRRMQDMPRLILLNVNLPKISGLEVLRQLKENDLTRSIPVVMLVSSLESPTTLEAMRLGCNECMVQAINFDEFSVTLGGLMSRYGAKSRKTRPGSTLSYLIAS